MSQADVADTTLASTLTIADLNTTINHEPRVLDLKIAEQLGMGDPHKIRATIIANMHELENYGPVSARRAETSKMGGRPGREFWLNEGQALVICALSRAPNSPFARKALITAFMELRRVKVSGVPQKSVRVKAHRRALPEPKPDAEKIDGHTLPDIVTVVFSNLFDMIREAESGRQRNAGSFSEMFIDALNGFLGAQDVNRIPKDASGRPFTEGSDQLRDLRTAVSTANLRIREGREKDFGTALEGVLTDWLAKQPNSGVKPSGKVLMDWHGRRVLEKERPLPQRANERRPSHSLVAAIVC